MIIIIAPVISKVKSFYKIFFTKLNIFYLYIFTYISAFISHFPIMLIMA